MGHSPRPRAPDEVLSKRQRRTQRALERAGQEPVAGFCLGFRLKCSVQDVLWGGGLGALGLVLHAESTAQSVDS